MRIPEFPGGLQLIKALCGFTLLLTWTGLAESRVDRDFAALKADAQKSFKDGVTPFVKTYCIGCHGQDRQKGGINFQPALSNAGDATIAKRWKQAAANVKAHDMPPTDAKKQPTDTERQAFLNGIAQIKFLSQKDPGLFVLRRLTKVEYGATLHDLFGVDSAIARELPDEVIGEGYLNTLSPLQSEQYLSIANEVLDQILPAGAATLNSVQRRWLGPAPRSGADLRVAARTVAGSLARKAYRRPPSEAELDVLLGVFDLGRTNGLAYNDALRLMAKAVLVSPQFLFITPHGEGQPVGGIVRLDDYQLASRLSYLLWSTMPDAELSGLADRGKLHDPAVLRLQVNRMLQDPRSRALFEGFGS